MLPFGELTVADLTVGKMPFDEGVNPGNRRVTSEAQSPSV